MHCGSSASHGRRSRMCVGVNCMHWRNAVIIGKSALIHARTHTHMQRHRRPSTWLCFAYPLISLIRRCIFYVRLAQNRNVRRDILFTAIFRQHFHVHFANPLRSGVGLEICYASIFIGGQVDRMPFRCDSGLFHGKKKMIEKCYACIHGMDSIRKYSIRN